MMKIYMFMMILLTNLLTTHLTPFTMGMIIFLNAIFLCMISRMVSLSSWVALSMFLIIIGGLMVLFLYTTSIYANQRFNKMKFWLPMTFTILIFPIFLYQNFYNMNYTFLSLANIMMKEYLKLFLPINMMSSMTMFFYLLLALFIMIFMLNYPKGPMRKKY